MSDPTLDSPLDLHEQPFALRIGGPDGADLFVERIEGDSVVIEDRGKRRAVPQNLEPRRWEVK